MDNVVSGYIPVLRFRPDAQRIVKEKFINEQVRRFFTVRSISEYFEIDDYSMITPSDFKNKKFLPFDCLYTLFFEHIDDTNQSYKAYSVVYDKSLTPDHCKDSNIFYGEIKLGKIPVIFIIYIDINEAAEFLRQYTLLPTCEHQ